MPKRPPAPETPAARRIKRKILVAITLTAFLPMLVVAYLVYSYAFPLLDAQTQERDLPWMLVMLCGTGLLMAAGSFMLWDLATSVVRHADASIGSRLVSKPGTSTPVASPETAAVQQYVQQSDEVDSLMQSFSRMLVTIEQQAADVNEYARRLDTAYKDLESTSAQLKEFSFKDEVTGLYNRRFFSIRLEEEMQRHRRFNHPVSVVLMDLDGFKAVNDELGHAVGDETLRDISQILMKHSRGINVVSRYGGDEFVVLLVETSKAGARLYADRIRQVVSTYPFSHGKRITASFGIASLPDEEAQTSEDLVRAADDALYAAKRAGKNQVAATDSPEKVP